MAKPKLVIILGPTGAGKSEVAVDIALRLGGEVVNADSQLVYRNMDIGTAKPSKSARERVPHYLIDIVDPDGEFNAALYRESALKAIQKLPRGAKRRSCAAGRDFT